VASFLLHPLATTRALLVVRIFLASVSTLTFTLALVTGIVSRYIYCSVCHNPAVVIIIRILIGLGVHSHPLPLPW
jgi:hypothetical protein